MIFRQILALIVTVLIAGLAVVIAFRVLVGLIRLLVIGAAIGIGAVLALYVIYKTRRLLESIRRPPRRKNI